MTRPKLNRDAGNNCQSNGNVGGSTVISPSRDLAVFIGYGVCAREKSVLIRSYLCTTTYSWNVSRNLSKSVSGLCSTAEVFRPTGWV